MSTWNSEQVSVFGNMFETEGAFMTDFSEKMNAVYGVLRKYARNKNLSHIRIVAYENLLVMMLI